MSAPRPPRFTVEDFHRMAQLGILAEDDRAELVRGEVVEMSPISARHAECVDRLAELFFANAGGRARVRVQNPIVLPDHSVPRPDLVLAHRRPGGYPRTHPLPEDLLLVVEAADRSLAYDRDVKVPLYAAAGIPEVWLVNLQDRVVEVFLDPAETGYGSVTRVRPGDARAPRALPEVALGVDAFLG